MSSVVEQIKSRLNIVDVIGSYIELQKAGSNLKARCPFHNEKSPSFFVSPARQTYHCFGCNRGGDMFSFVEEIEGLDFSGALKILADRAGVELQKFDSGKKSEKEKIFTVLEIATAFFEKELEGNQSAKKYLLDRGLTEETIKDFKIGYARDEWRSLFDFLKTKKVPEHMMEKAGLMIKTEKGYYDRFRGRVMFPISDSSGRIVGFSGRVFPEADRNTDKGQAKYVNSPETDVYKKSEILYGIDKAKTAIRKNGFCILVEGQMDLIMSHQAGFTNTVAVSGTAFSEEHLSLLSRFGEKLVFAFDSDDAGFAASRRGVDLALSKGVDIAMVELEGGKDPAEVVLKSPDEWKRAVEGAQHIVDFYVSVLSKKGYDKRELGLKISEIVLPYVAVLKNKIDQAHFVAKIAGILGISEDPLWNELRMLPQEKVVSKVVPVQTLSPQKIISRKSALEDKILGIYIWQDENKKSSTSCKEKIEKEYQRITGMKIQDKISSLDEEWKKEMLFRMEISYGDGEGVEEEVGELLVYFESEALREVFSDTMRKIKEAEARGDSGEATELLKICQDITQKINKLSAI